MANEKKVRFAGTPKISLSPRNGFQLAAANELAGGNAGPAGGPGGTTAGPQ